MTRKKIRFEFLLNQFSKTPKKVSPTIVAKEKERSELYKKLPNYQSEINQKKNRMAELNTRVFEYEELDKVFKD